MPTAYSTRPSNPVEARRPGPQLDGRHWTRLAGPAGGAGPTHSPRSSLVVPRAAARIQAGSSRVGLPSRPAPARSRDPSSAFPAKPSARRAPGPRACGGAECPMGSARGAALDGAGPGDSVPSPRRPSGRSGRGPAPEPSRPLPHHPHPLPPRMAPGLLAATARKAIASRPCRERAWPLRPSGPGSDADSSPLSPHKAGPRPHG